MLSMWRVRDESCAKARDLQLPSQRVLSVGHCIKDNGEWVYHQSLYVYIVTLL